MILKSELDREAKGGQYKKKETVKMVYLAKCEMHSSSARVYEESPLSAKMAIERAVGYMQMAEELEPFNPYVLDTKAWITDLSTKSSEYMINLYAECLVKMKLCKEHGYKDLKYKSTIEPAIKFEMENVLNGRLYYVDYHD